MLVVIALRTIEHWASFLQNNSKYCDKQRRRSWNNWGKVVYLMIRIPKLLWTHLFQSSIGSVQEVQVQMHLMCVNVNAVPYVLTSIHSRRCQIYVTGASAGNKNSVVTFGVSTFCGVWCDRCWRCCWRWVWWWQLVAFMCLMMTHDRVVDLSAISKYDFQYLTKQVASSINCWLLVRSS